YGDLGQYTVSGNLTPILTFTLARSTDGQYIDWTAGGSSGQIAINDPDGLTFTGDLANDTIMLDYSHGSPLPPVLHLRGTFTVNGLQGSSPFAGTTLEIGQST